MSYLKAAMLAAGLCLALISNAQRHILYVSRDPVKDMSTARGTLFNLPAKDSAYYFRADLPGDNFLAIQFGKLSYWQSGMIPEIFKLAKQSWEQVQDSFSGTTTARKLSIHVPAANYPIIAATKEYGADEKVLLLKGQQVQPLRIAVDTLTVLKLLSPDKDDTANKRQIQYTFLMKDLSEIAALADNEELVANIEHTFDSLVTVMRARWKNQDAYYRHLQARYDARPEAGKRKLQTTIPGSLLNGLEYTGEIGTSFIAGTIATYGNLKLSLMTSKESFVALSYSAIGFAKMTDNKLSISSTGFLNIEFGARYISTASVPIYRTSVGYGYRVSMLDPAPYDFRHRFFFNYSLSQAVTVTPDFYVIPKRGDTKAISFVGITLAVKILRLTF